MFYQVPLSIVFCCLSMYIYAQNHDYNFINRSTPHGSGTKIEFSDSLQDIKLSIFEWSGTISGSQILSDKNGKFLGYFNCRNLYDSIGRIAINGDSMAVGFFQNYLFPFLPDHEGLGNGSNAFFIPISDSLYYLFYKSSELWAGAPGFAVNFVEQGKKLTSYSDGLYLSKVRLNKDNRLFILPDEKHLLLVDDLFQYKNLMFCKHANGEDWWLIAPKALDSEAYRFRVYADGEIEQLDNIEFSDNFWRIRSTSEFSFSPNGEYLARIFMRPSIGFKNILELFTFDRCEGLVERILVDSLPLAERYTSAGDVEFSENGQFLYLALGSIILQMDLNDPEYFTNRDTIAEWDGFFYFEFLEPIFDALWKLPNGKILAGSAVSTPFLHYIHEPNLKGDLCAFEQRALMFPDDPLNAPFGVDIEALPEFPPFRMKALKYPCFTVGNEINTEVSISLNPNPATEFITIFEANGMYIMMFNLDGLRLQECKIPNFEVAYNLNISYLYPGIYFIKVEDKERNLVSVLKFIKV